MATLMQVQEMEMEMETVIYLLAMLNSSYKESTVKV